MAVSSDDRFGAYQIRGTLGAGGMGTVYLADDTRLNRKVAIKVLSAGDANARGDARLLREAQAAAALDHPNICAIYEVGEANGSAFIVMQYIEGETLADRLKRKPLALHEAIEFGAAIAEGLAEAQARGIVHRDIKPQNVMISTRGQVKILDFGLAKILEDEAGGQDVRTETVLTQAGAVVGTLPYMSPEQVKGELLDARSDIFSFGAVLYEMVSGRRMFAAKTSAETISAILMTDAPPLSGISREVPPALERIIRKCTEKNREQRYRTMGEVARDLDHVRHEHARGTIRSEWLSPRRRVVAGVLTLLLLVAAAIYWRPRTAAPAAPAASSVSVNSPAYTYYARGKVNASSQNADSNAAAISLLEQAVATDPAFAPAYAELAAAYAMRGFYFAPPAERKKSYEDAEVAVQKALALDPNLAEAHFARGLILWAHYKRFPHEQAVQAFKRSLALNPRLDEAHHQLALVYFHVGLLDKAWQEVDAALALNPGNTLARFRYGVINMYRGKYEEALDIFNTTPLETNPALSAFQTAHALFQLRRDAEATALIAKFLKEYPKDEGGVGTSVKAMLLARAGRRREATEAIARAVEIGQGFGHFHHTAYNVASAYALLDEPGLAVQWLQTAAADGFPCYPLYDSDPNLRSLRGNEAFIALLAKLKLQWERYAATL
jgi:tetratricopeptide (TPR) repeat protein/predicted Ser/Thr protein kinase